MARSLLGRMPNELEQDGHTFLLYRETEADAQKKKEGARDRIKGWLTLKNQAGKFVNGEEDENGNRVFPWTVAGKKIIAQRKLPTPVIDLEAAEKLLREKGETDALYPERLYDMVFRREVVRVFNEDALFMLNQKGAITDEEMDALEVQGDASYALVVADE